MSQNGQFDALLIGAGPSGSTAAALLAEHGHNVLLIEREKFPRYHIGESLLPFTYEPLKRLGLIQRPICLQHRQGVAAVLLQHPLRRRRGTDMAGVTLRV